MIDHYCCFICADQNKTEDRKLEQICPKCGNEYGFPLSDYPQTINGFEVIKPLNRGYYSVAYKVKHPKFTNKISVLKVIPKLIYENHGKNFEKECQEHDKIASNSDHIVKIPDFFDAKLNFGTREIDSHIAELEFVDGFPLEKVIDGEEDLTAPECTQVALDLFHILFDLRKMEVRHNDLHGGNVIVQRLNESQYRLGAVEPRIRVKAIDINSATGTGEAYLPNRPRDIQRVAWLIRQICQKLLNNPDKVEDLHFRALTKLVEISYLLDTNSKDNRAIELEEIIRIIKTEYDESQFAQSAPWKKPLSLTAINDYYNAQALEPWFASHLFVDPENKWLTSINSPGPQLITGMRGCGKTILLKSLQFHSSANNSNDFNDSQKIVERLKNDGYVGLYVSSSRLIDASGDADFTEAFSILFIAFMKSAIQAIKHLADLDGSLVSPSYHENFTNLLLEIFPKSTNLKTGHISDTFLNYELEKIQFSLYRREEEFKIPIKPIIAFENLAREIQKSSSIWHNHHIFFLLDDVSTRYVDEESIRKLISQLLIQNPSFSFKFTSEQHTIRYLLHSPGNIEIARIGRDYSLFDFGSAVREKIHGSRSKGRKKFVEDILKKRFSYYQRYNDRKYHPQNLLGDKKLEDLARTIGQSTKTSVDRKKLYSGFSVLIGMCVGDIGDILNLYHRFLQLSENGKPLTENQQTTVYLDFSSLRLYDLKRRKTDMEKYVMGFAAASHNRLMESYKNLPESGRIRQFNSIYVRITSKDTNEQENTLKKINKLIDAGIFVSSGIAFRTKTRDSNPLLQFSLVFRKIFGLSHFIGLAQKDRFELSGDDVNKWLDFPEKTEEILLACPVSEEPDSDELVNESEENVDLDSLIQVKKSIEMQGSLFDDLEESLKINEKLSENYDLPQISMFVEPSQLTSRVDNLILGLGFEERTIKSIERYSNHINPKLIIAYRYSPTDYSTDTLKYIENKYPQAKIEISAYENFGDGFNLEEGTNLIDVSGLSKALIFNVVRQSMSNRNDFYIAHTESESYYPTDEEMIDVLNAYNDNDPTEFLDSLDNILGGEFGPYQSVNLLKTESDKARNRLLIGFAKPKNERLYHIIDNREFDQIELIKPRKDSSNRSKVASLIADIVGRKYNNTVVSEFEANDLEGILEFIFSKYHEYYLNLHYNVEIALTGSKRQTIAIGLLSAFCKLSKVWYVKPKQIDESRFSTGVGKSSYFKVEPPKRDAKSINKFDSVNNG